MGRSVLFYQNTSSSPAKCAPVSITPNSGTTPKTVTFTDATTNAHIFFNLKSGFFAPDPTHAGDNPIAPTQRIGSNNGTINIGAGNWALTALAYEPTHQDSDVTDAQYDASGH